MLPAPMEIHAFEMPRVVNKLLLNKHKIDKNRTNVLYVFKMNIQTNQVLSFGDA